MVSYRSHRSRGERSRPATIGPRHDRLGVRVELSAHSSATMLNEVRVGDTAERDADAPRAPRSRPVLPWHSGDSVERGFPNTLPTFSSRLSAARIAAEHASDFHTSVTEVADTLRWVKARHSLKAGLDFRWERLNVVQPPSPTGSFTFNAIGSDRLASGHRNAARQPPARPGADLLDRPAAVTDQGACHFQEYFVQDDWRSRGASR